MSVIQPAQERYELAAAALESLYQSAERDGLPELATEELRRDVLRRFLSYDLLEEFLADPSVEDIMINATDPVFVHKTGEGLVKTERRFATNRELAVFVNKLVVFGGRSEVDPINDLELADIRGRVNIIQSPFGPHITVTRGKPKPLTILHLIEQGCLPYELAAQLWLYVEGLRVRPANLIIAGGPGAGKTTLLNALLSFLPPRERIVTIEDTLELNTACLDNCARLESCRRMKTPELVKNSLRMRPARILVGEVRGAEARDLMTAMNLGKYCMSTLHASSARETIMRLEHEPMNVPPILVNLVDVFVILKKLNVAGDVRRVVSEVVETAGMEQQVVLLSTVWSYDAARHGPVEEAPSSAYRDRLAAESGRTPRQIMEEVARRAEVLRRLQAMGQCPEIADVTRCCQRYSDEPAQAFSELGLPANGARPQHRARRW
jgi:flagellar protein FlaI